MALFHLHVTQVKRSVGQSIVTSAAYRAGEKLYSKNFAEAVNTSMKAKRDRLNELKELLRLVDPY